MCVLAAEGMPHRNDPQRRMPTHRVSVPQWIYRLCVSRQNSQHMIEIHHFLSSCCRPTLSSCAGTRNAWSAGKDCMRKRPQSRSCIVWHLSRCMTLSRPPSSQLPQLLSLLALHSQAMEHEDRAHVQDANAQSLHVAVESLDTHRMRNTRATTQSLQILPPHLHTPSAGTLVIALSVHTMLPGEGCQITNEHTKVGLLARCWQCWLHWCRNCNQLEHGPLKA